MPNILFSNEQILSMLSLIQERRDSLFCKIDNKLTVNNKSTSWKQLCDDFIDITKMDVVTVEKILKKWDNLKSKLRQYVTTSYGYRPSNGTLLGYHGTG